MENPNQRTAVGDLTYKEIQRGKFELLSVEKLESLGTFLFKKTDKDRIVIKMMPNA